MATGRNGTKPRRIAIVGGGISGLGAAWALHHHPDRFDFRLYEAGNQVGGNAITADMPQDGGGCSRRSPAFNGSSSASTGSAG